MNGPHLNVDSFAAERVKNCVPWYAHYQEIYESASRLEKTGEHITYLQVAVPEFDVPEYVYEAVRRYSKFGIKTIPFEGLEQLREAVAEKMDRKNHMLVDPKDEVIITVGALQGLNAAVQTFVGPGDEVLIPQPAFGFDAQVILAGGRPVYVPLSEDKKFAFEADEFEKRVGSHTKMIIISTPHNPTGHVATLNELESIAEIVRKHDLLVLSDEVFENFVFNGRRHHSIGSLPGMKERTITVNSLSKNYCMYTWRVGYLVADKQIMKHIKTVHSWTIAFHPPLIQLAALAMLRGPQEWITRMVDEYERRANVAVNSLNEIPGISCIRPEGTIVCFPNVSRFKLPSIKLAKYLVDNAKVVTSPGEAWLKEGYLRIALTIPEREIITVFERMKKALENLSVAR